MDPDPIRVLTARLAELLGDEDGGLLLAQLQKLRLLAALAERMDQRWTVELDLDAAPRPVGAWRPHETDAGLELVRRTDLPPAEEKFWAADSGIPPKGSRHRIVLIGESVARGYLFDPALSFADVLRALAPEDVEIVDLACTNLTARGLQEVLSALPALSPDAVAVFAGNNWDNIPLGLAELDRCAAGLRRDGFRAVRQVFQDDLLLPQARAVIEGLAKLRSGTGVEIAMLVPETNLVDWRPERSVLTAVLPSNRTADWLTLRERAVDELAADNAVAAADTARRMLSIDEGLSPTSSFLLGTALHRAGAHREARLALEGARDAFCGLLVPHPPRCPGQVQALLRDACHEHDLRLVDLPTVFEEHTGDLPGRRMFLDYCHLTLEGMRVAAAATLAAVRPALDPTALLKIQVPLAPSVEGTAHLLAALHNAHYGQSNDLVRHHMRVALDRSPDLAAIVADLIKAQVTRWPSWLTAAFVTVSRSAQAARYLVPDNPNRLAKTADYELARAAAEVLEEAGGPVPDPDELVVEGHGPGAGRVDLVEPRFHARTFQEYVGQRMGGVPGYYRGHEPRSTFYLICADGRPRRLRLTARVPGLDSGGVAEVWLNDEPLATARVRCRWTVAEFDAPAARLRRGPNRLEVRWPPPEQAATAVFEHGARRLERGQLPDVLPIFGEVHSFTATPKTLES